MTTREPLDIDRLTRHLVESGTYARIAHTPETGSTNTDVVALARQGAPAWTALLTEYQNAGRGRHGRAWTAPHGSQLILSVLLRPPAQALDNLGTMPLITGLAVVDALTAMAEKLGREEIIPVLKWPNDALIGGRKLCGMLGEAVSLGPNPALVMGLGLNVSLTTAELPVPHAISLDLAAPGLELDRTELAIEVLRALRTRLGQWATNDPQAMADYRAACSSLGADVRVLLPGDRQLLGTVTNVDDDGRLRVRDNTGTEHTVAAGDVEHLRLQQDPWESTRKAGQ